MKKKKKELRTICPFDYHRKKISHGIGIRLGDPTGLTYKLYWNERTYALEVTGGVGFSGLYSPIHRQNFQDIDEYEGFEYIAHEVDYSIAHQGRIQFHQQFPSFGRLNWYISAGYHIRWFRIRYIFNFVDTDGRNDVGSDFYDDFDFGPELAFGFEFDYPNVPITVFAEGGGFYNVMGLNNFFRFQAGLGVRYDF